MKAKLIILFFALTFIIGCKSKTNYDKVSEFKEARTESFLMEQEMPSPPPPPSAEMIENPDKKIIKTAYLNIEVLNYDSSRKLIDATLKIYKAYVVNENLQNNDYQITNNLNIKVPADKFEILLKDISKFAKKVDYQNIEMQDVTEEFIDVETRLANSRKVEQTYIRLLRKTDSIEDILKIEQKLGEIRTDIESTQGRLKYLNHQVNLSSINLTIYQKIDFKYVPEKSEGFFQRLIKSIDLGWKGIVSVFLFIIKLWPLWLLAALGWYGWKFFVYNRKQRKIYERRRKKIEKKQRKEVKVQPEITES
ncbi:MAG: DUF4349 domain-containing protein [Tenuifilaceae bacterium]